MPLSGGGTADMLRANFTSLRITPMRTMATTAALTSTLILIAR